MSFQVKLIFAVRVFGTFSTESARTGHILDRPLQGLCRFGGHRMGLARLAAWRQDGLSMLSVDLPAFESGVRNNVPVQLTTPRRPAPQVWTRLRYVAH